MRGGSLAGIGSLALCVGLQVTGGAEVRCTFQVPSSVGCSTSKTHVAAGRGLGRFCLCCALEEAGCMFGSSSWAQAFFPAPHTLFPSVLFVLSRKVQKFLLLLQI